MMPKDTILPIGKLPRRQKSSRFHVAHKVELERYPDFHGNSLFLLCHIHNAYLNPCISRGGTFRKTRPDA